MSDELRRFYIKAAEESTAPLIRRIHELQRELLDYKQSVAAERIEKKKVTARLQADLLAALERIKPDARAAFEAGFWTCRRSGDNWQHVEPGVSFPKWWERRMSAESTDAPDVSKKRESVET